MIDAGLIGPLINLLQTAEFDIKKEAAWAISNATSGGTNEQILYVSMFSDIFCGSFDLRFFLLKPYTFSI